MDAYWLKHEKVMSLFVEANPLISGYVKPSKVKGKFDLAVHNWAYGWFLVSSKPTTKKQAKKEVEAIVWEMLKEKSSLKLIPKFKAMGYLTAVK